MASAVALLNLSSGELPEQMVLFDEVGNHRSFGMFNLKVGEMRDNADHVRVFGKLLLMEGRGVAKRF